MLVEHPSFLQRETDGLEETRRDADPWTRRLVLVCRRRVILEMEVILLRDFDGWTAVGPGDGLDTGHRRNAFERSRPECMHRRRVRIRARGQRDRRREDLRGIDTDGHITEPDQRG